MPLPSDLLKKVLVQLHSTVMPHMPNPLLLSDFLTRCLDEGGLVGMLALNGIFTLVTKHGLEYPNFYSRLYALLQVCILLVVAQTHVVNDPGVVLVTCQCLHCCHLHNNLLLGLDSVSVLLVKSTCRLIFVACHWLHRSCAGLGLHRFAQTGCHQRCVFTCQSSMLRAAPRNLPKAVLQSCCRSFQPEHHSCNRDSDCDVTLTWCVGAGVQS